MNRENFLKTFFNLYKNTFNEENSATWLEAYKSVLGMNVDFDRLYNTMLLEWDKRTAPPPAWLKQRATYIQGQEPEEPVIKNIYGTAPTGFEYCFGYCTHESNFALEAENLIKMGFTNIRGE